MIHEKIIEHVEAFRLNEVRDFRSKNHESEISNLIKTECFADEMLLFLSVKASSNTKSHQRQSLLFSLDLIVFSLRR